MDKYRKMQTIVLLFFSTYFSHLTIENKSYNAIGAKENKHPGRQDK